MNLKDNKLVRYFAEAKTELEKVTWPSRKETITYTLLVVGVSVGVAVFLGAIDFGLNKVLETLIAQ
jgi:preprotein translocase subunit SecE